MNSLEAPPTHIRTGQLIYLGPHVGFLGLYFHKGWKDGIEPQLYPWFDKCPALGSLIVPVKDTGAVLRELNFDPAHNMRGTTGAFVTFYREAQKWLTTQTTEKSNIKMKETTNV